MDLSAEDAMPSGGEASELYRVGDLVVDVTGASVSRGAERLVLPPRTFELLVALVRRYPRTVRRHDLLDTVWRDDHVTDQALSHRVLVLRKALGDHAEEPAYVAGERGFGYRLVAPVTRLDPERPASAVPPPAPVAPDGPGRSRRPHGWLFWSALLVTVALVGDWIASRAARRRRGRREPPPGEHPFDSWDGSGG